MRHIRAIPRFLLAILMACWFFMPAMAYADGNSLYLSPGNTRFDPGATFNVSVYANAPVSGWSTTTSIAIQFPSTILQATGYSMAGSALGSATPTIDNQTGQITYSSYNFFPISGNNLLVFTVSFKAVSTGNAPLTFAPSSTVNSSATSLQNATYTIAAATCPSGTVGTPPNCTTPPAPAPAPAPAPKPAPAPAPAPITSPDLSSLINPIIVPTMPNPTPISTETGSLSITNVKTNPYWNTASLSWNTSAPDVTTVVQFGTSKDKLTTTLNAQQQADGTFHTDKTNLEPGVRYYYLINAISTSSGGQATYSGSFTTHGYPTKLTITENKQPASGAAVKLNGETYNANASGVIQFELPAGAQQATLTTNDGSSQTVKFTVAKANVPVTGKAPATQNFSFDINTQSSNSGANLWFIIGGAIGLVLLLGLLIFFLLWRRRRAEQSALPVANVDDYAWQDGANGSAVQSVEQQYIPEAEQPYAELGTENAQDIAASLAAQQAAAMPTEAIDANQWQPAMPAFNPEYQQPIEQMTPASPYPEMLPVSPYDPSYVPAPIDNPALVSLPQQPITNETYSQQPMPPVEDSPTLDNADNREITLEEITPDEPSAIYHESTGELDIIHHGSQHAGGSVS